MPRPPQTEQQKKSKIINCRVCGVLVPRRASYQPRICCACQKFFARNYPRRARLTCTGERRNCLITPDGRSCPFCRLAKCLFVGMKVKPEKTQPVDKYQESPHENSQNFACETLSLPNHDPSLVTDAAIDHMIKMAMSAFTYLHDLEFLPLKVFDGDYNAQVHHDLCLQHVSRIVDISKGYTGFLKKTYAISDEEERIMLKSGMAAASIAYPALPSNANKLQINEKLILRFRTFAPELEPAFTSAADVALLFEQWQPSMIHCSLLFVLLFLNANQLQSFDRLICLRRCFMLAFRSACLKSSKDVNDSCRHEQLLSQALSFIDRTVVKLRQARDLAGNRDGYRTAELQLFDFFLGKN